MKDTYKGTGKFGKMRDYLQIVMVYLLVITSLFIVNPNEAKVKANDELLSKTMSFNGSCRTPDGNAYISTQGTTNMVFSKFNKDVHVGGSYATIPDWVQFDYNGRTLRTEYTLANQYSSTYNTNTYDITGGGKTPTNYALSELSKVNFSSIKVAPITVSRWEETYDKYGNLKGSVQYSCTIPTSDMVIREVTQTTSYKPNGTVSPKLYKTPGNQYRTVQTDSRGVFNVTGVDSTYYSTYLIYEYDGQTYLSTGGETGYVATYSTIYKLNNGVWDYYAYGQNNFLRPAESSAIIFPDASKFSEWLLLSSYSKSSHIPNPNTNNIGFNGAGQEYMVTDAYLSGAGQLTSCPSGMELVKGSNPYCKQTVVNKESVNINLGDITNNLNGKDFGGANDHNSSLVINNGKVTDNHNTNGLSGYDSNFINFTNVSSDGKITSLTNTFQPQFTITYKGKMLKAPKPTDVTQVQQYDKALSEFTSQAGTDINSHSSVEAILFKVDSIDELGKVTKDKDALMALFNKDSNQKYVQESKIKYAHLNKQGLINYENFKVDQEGLYILGSKFVDQTKKGTLSEKTTYTFKPLEISFLNTAGYLPLSNYVVGQVNNMYMSVGLKKKDHGLSNLEYSNAESHYESMKVPSAYNYTNGFSALGSTNGGLKLLDTNLNDIKITSDSTTVEDLKVTDVVEHGEGFYVSSEQGVFYLDTNTKKLIATSVVDPVLDLEKKGDTIITLSEDKVLTYFIVGTDLLPSTREHDLSGMFSSNKKAGKFELTGDILTVSTKDEGVDSEVVFLGTK